ncbi:lipoprotein [Cupriavidus sp. TKC]|nr:lipoprotein [Cupriavidus sp. TKC]
MTSQQSKPWYREPWPWLLMSGPLLAIIGCGVTIWLANTHPDLPVSGVERHGLVVEKTGAEHVASPAARRP